MPTSTSRAIAPARSAGFTLVELLVVVLLIAITASLAVVSLRTDERALVRGEAARLAESLRHMQDEAILTGATFAWRGEPLGYEYLRRAPDRTWLPMEGDGAALSRRLPEPVRLVDIEVDGAKLAPGALLLLSPVLLAIALAVRASSPGPIIFRQRRYGLDGREIIVYKFRTMTVTEDGERIVQAKRDDQRITRIGRFLRRYSLDELPQLVNVVQGRMSLIGPRPHAVAHNEEYRRLIKGYMVRHKVLPGITGLAQVSGCRGETSTLEEMQARIGFDLEYLRRWSISLDLKILFRTAMQLLTDRKAY